jgi:sugar lactone lactonase YvrE
VDSAGNVYVADTGNHTIRKISPAGAVTTLAGLAGSSGSANGTGSTARFNGPSGVAVDSAGNVYVADTGNHTIRKVTPAGAVTTLAGQAGAPGTYDGPGNVARFYQPCGVAVDGAGNVYVADKRNNTIRKITPAGAVTTLAGQAGASGTDDGPGNVARFYAPCGVAVDSAGNVYVADGNYTIRKITPAGAVGTLAGLAGFSGSDDATGIAARFRQPGGVAVDGAGDVYVADTGNHTIRKISPAGAVTTLAGLAGSSGSTNGTGSAARFTGPSGVAVDNGGNVYVADTGNLTIRKITPAVEVTTLAGLPRSEGSTDGTGSTARFNTPSGVAVDSAGNVYIADSYNCTIRKCSPAGAVTTLAGLARSSGSTDGTGSTARFSYPDGVAVDSVGNVYVADTYNYTIRKISAAGSVTTLAGLAGNSGSTNGTVGTARFDSPSGVAVDSAGNVYVADTDNHTIRKITPAGVVTTLAGLAGTSGSTNGTGSNARFYRPSGVAVDGSGHVYVADTYNHTIRKITPAGEVRTLAGLAGSSGNLDGLGSSARFYRPSGVAVDSEGNVYVADTGKHTVRKITPGGEVKTLAGAAGASGSADGLGSAARFYEPSGVAVDPAGKVYVADTLNYAIRLGVRACPDLAVIDRAIGALGQTRQLDTAPQTATSWYWEVLRRPADSTAQLSSPTARNPQFTPDVPDLYIFRLKATNDLGQISIRTVELLAGPPPMITSQPESLTVTPGTNAFFSADAAAMDPGYQWQKEGTNLVDGGRIQGASTPTLLIAAVQGGDVGSYWLVVSNKFGAATSQVATLSLKLPGDALGQPAWEWTSYGQGGWFSQSQTTHDGEKALQSGRIGGSQRSVLQTTVVGPGLLSFWWRVSSEEGGDYLRFYLNGAEVAAISGETGWEQRSFGVAAGGAILEWAYEKDFLLDGGQDAGWVDDVAFGPAYPVITRQPVSQIVLPGQTAGLEVEVTGSLPLGFQWFRDDLAVKDDGNLAGGTSAKLAINEVQPLHAGDYLVVVSNAFGWATSQVARLDVVLPPVITRPPSDLCAPLGGEAVFSVQTSSLVPVAYQWRFNGQDLPGETNATLHLRGVAPAQGGGYTVIVSNILGAVTSAPPTVLTVILPPAIIAQPRSQALVEGDELGLAVLVSGSSPFQYQWLLNGARLTDGPRVAGATASQLTITAVTFADAGVYAVMATNLAGSVTSAVAVVTVGSLGLGKLGTDALGRFEFEVRGDVGKVCKVQASTNLIRWSTLATFTNTSGLWPFLDPATNFSYRFYRAVSGP